MKTRRKNMRIATSKNLAHGMHLFNAVAPVELSMSSFFFFLAKLSSDKKVKTNFMKNSNET